METDYLREFEAFAQTMNYSKAAKQVYVSQPTLVSHLSALEKHVGTPLIEKAGDTPRLTPAGKYLLSKMGTVLDAVDALLGECRHVSESTLELNIRSDTAFFNSALDAARERFVAQHPGMHVEYAFVSNYHDRTTMLDNGTIDFDIGARYALIGQTDSELERAELDGTVLFPQIIEPELFWVTQDSDLFTKESVSIADLNGRTILITENPSSHAMGAYIERLLSERSVHVKLMYRTFSSLREYYMSDMRQAIGIVSPSTTQNIGFNGPDKTRRAFMPEGLDIATVIYTACQPAALGPLKREFVETLEMVGRERCGEFEKETS